MNIKEEEKGKRERQRESARPKRMNERKGNEGGRREG